MALVGVHAPGATPLRPEDIAGLKPAVSWITTNEQLNQVEAANIAEYEAWAKKARLKSLEEVLSDDFLMSLHRRMFGNVWRWAGKYRLHDLQNEFASPYPRIREQMHLVWGDVSALATLPRDKMPAEEIGVRLHHRIVRVHPFNNGNGRASRAMADLALEKVFNVNRLAWGRGNLATIGELRAAYTAALGCADRGDYRPLIDFCVSNPNVDLQA